MIKRLVNPSNKMSFFLFGARGTGKSTWIQAWVKAQKKTRIAIFDLLNEDTESRFSKNPESLAREILGLKQKPEWVVIDEIQKVPRLMNVIHSLIENEKIKFVLSGSSARKLKKIGANLLAGRAFDYRLFPFSAAELKDKFDLSLAMAEGMLPQIYQLEEAQDRQKYLKSYVSTYVKMEVQMEQLLRRLDPFRSFLEIAAQMNGKPLNMHKISKDVGVDSKTILSYYEVLDDTYLGFFLPSFHLSIRKSQRQKPKFYFFDPGVKRALEGSLLFPAAPRTSYFGETFEHLVILEFYKLNHYFESDFRLSYFQTHDESEVDLILSRGKNHILVEIKSTDVVDELEVRRLSTYAKELKGKAYYLSQCPERQMIDGILCLHWLEGLEEIFGKSKLSMPR
jgi:predicted AAA+ superfamily ATPase